MAFHMIGKKDGVWSMKMSAIHKHHSYLKVLYSMKWKEQWWVFACKYMHEYDKNNVGIYTWQLAKEINEKNVYECGNILRLGRDQLLKCNSKVLGESNSQLCHLPFCKRLRCHHLRLMPITQLYLRHISLNQKW